MVSAYHVAQFNIGTVRAPVEDPLMRDFMEALDTINALAEASPGFVWRLQTDAGNATDIHAFDDPATLVNMSVWQSVDQLFDFVYKTAHMGFMRRRGEWFRPAAVPYMALWWIPAGTEPTVADAKSRLRHLAEHGPTPRAFTFAQRFPPPAQDALRAAASV